MRRKRCKGCGAPLTIKTYRSGRFETPSQFRRRQYCGIRCVPRPGKLTPEQIEEIPKSPEIPKELAWRWSVSAETIRRYVRLFRGPKFRRNAA